MKFRHLLLLLMLASPLANAMNAIFWQPQLRDTSATAEQWNLLMHKLRQQGFDTLVLQWTQYGTAFAEGKERQQLQQRAEAARAAGLKVIVGLYADPDFFERQKQTASALTNYLDRLREADIKQAKEWSTHADGWYIGAEIDDHNWRTPEARKQLQQWLGQTRRQLIAVNNLPVSISSFFAGNMTPDSYSQMLTEIDQLGIHVWVQDGRGVDVLTRQVRETYLNASAGCQSSTPASGIVYEVFQATPGKTFKATPLSPKELTRRMAQKSDCGKSTLYFSLRYLPIAKGTLQH